MKSFTDYLNEKMNSHNDCDELVEGCGCDGTNEDVSSKDAGRIGAAISNRKDLPASEKNVARRSLQRKVARAQRREKAFNVNADSGSRYRVGTKRPTDDTDPKHKGLRRNAAIAKTLKSYGTNEDVEQVDELSAKALKKYRVKSIKDREDTVRQGYNPNTGQLDPEAEKRRKKRLAGFSRAKRKLVAAEDVEQVDEACWDSHVQRGTKMKGGKVVPNCVPRNEGTEEIDELKMPRRDERGNIKSRKIRGAYQAGSLRASDKDHEHMDKSFDSDGDKQIDHMKKSIAAGERSNARFKKALKRESVEEAKKKIKVKLDPKKKIGYEVRSVGPGGKTTVTKRRDMPDKEDVGEASGAWQRKEGKNKEGGLNAAGRASYERENPGSDLKAPVSAEQAKKSKGGKAAKRRKSFCARMGGMKGAMKDEKGRPTRKALALRKWDC